MINLAHVRRRDLLGELEGFEFVILDDVVAEITYPEARTQLEAALAAGHVRQVSVTDPDVIEIFAELRQIMGRGEAACLALAEKEGWVVASDERRVFRREVVRRLGEGRQLTTPGLFLLAIRAGALTVDEADAAKAALEQRRFQMNFRSFRDLTEDE